MTDFDQPTKLLIELAKAVVAEMRSSHPDWKEVFIRMQADEGFFEVKCSYALPTEKRVLDVLAHKPFISQVRRIGVELREKLPHPNRWRISKMSGGTGAPEGYVPA